MTLHLSPVLMYSETIRDATTIPANANWQIQLGRGQSGNCNGAGMTLKKETELLIYRFGD